LNVVQATVSAAGVRGNLIMFSTIIEETQRPATVINLRPGPTTLTHTWLVSPPPAILVKDQLGNPYRNATVTWSVIQGNSLRSGGSRTDSLGIAALAEWGLLSTGAHTLTATVLEGNGCTIEGNPAWFYVNKP
jgi:hypothetical protein